VSISSTSSQIHSIDGIHKNALGATATAVEYKTWGKRLLLFIIIIIHEQYNDKTIALVEV